MRNKDKRDHRDLNTQTKILPNQHMTFMKTNLSISQQSGHIYQNLPMHFKPSWKGVNRLKTKFTAHQLLT